MFIKHLSQYEIFFSSLYLYAVVIDDREKLLKHFLNIEEF